MGNLAAALTGCCPINGSGLPDGDEESSIGGKDTTDRDCGGTFDDRAPPWRNRVYRLSSGAGATAIVISALLGATEFELAVRLWKVSRTECLIFAGAFFRSADAWDD